jgi:hypothetical protein
MSCGLLQARHRLFRVLDGAGGQVNVNEESEQRHRPRTDRVNSGQSAFEDLTRAFDLALCQQQHGKRSGTLLVD